MQDPLGGITLFPRVGRTSCLAQQDCEFVTLPHQNATFQRENKVTVILMGYKPARSNNYLQLFEGYTAMRNTVERVVFIWNNLETDPPPVPPEVHLIRASRNDMMNRYTLTKDFPHTNSILTVDDDVLLSEGLLRCMLIQLLAHNASIVGLDARRVEPGTGNYMSGPPTLDKPVVIIGKTMLMHERVHRRAAEIPDALRKAVQKGGVCESCDDLVMNAVATAASGVGPVQLRHNIWPHVRMRLPAPGGVSSTSDWYGPDGRRSACVRWLFEHFDDDSLFRPRSVRKQMRCVDIYY
tara:strand:+ start:387 stop:1271 length:885 start_codon:yes stop_codon:yes gene_type:complete